MALREGVEASCRGWDRVFLASKGVRQPGFPLPAKGEGSASWI